MAAKNRWLLPSNTINMRMIIAQGLITSPNGFKKYYTDALELFPGYIPLYKNTVPYSILEKGISERNSLTPCIMEFDIHKMEGQVKIFKDDELIDIEIKNVDHENVDMIFVLAPLPLTCISQILFNSNNDKKQFEADALNRSNVVLSGFNLQSRKIDQKLFIQRSLTSTLSYEKLPTDYETIDYNKVYAFGGMIANLFYNAKNGTESNNVFKASCLKDTEFDSCKDCEIILNYFYSSLDVNNQDPTEVIYKNLIDTAINSKDFKEAVIEFLEQGYSAKFAQKLKDIESRSDKPISEEFKSLTQLYGKSILMLFLREDTESLIDYDLDLFSETDYIIFIMIFGIRDKFIKIPKFIREYEGLQNFISTKMANYAHETLNNQIKFKEPKQPLTIIDMLKKDRFKEYFAKELIIENCFQTIIPKSDYIVVKGKPVFTGIVMPKFELLEEKYFEFISKYKLTEYNNFLQKYEKIK